MRMLDDVYGAELDGFPLEQTLLPTGSDLEWDEPSQTEELRYLDRLFQVHWGPLQPDQP